MMRAALSGTTKKNSLNRSLVRDSEHKVDEGEGGAATFDSKRAEVNDEILE
jgi:hypothetical protein